MIPQASLSAFQTSLRGQLLLPNQPGYDEARKLHNAMIDKRPAAIVRCAGVADVIAAVKFARSQGIVTSVRGTGHNVAGFALCDDGLVIDLCAMKGIHANPAARTARVEPGVTWAELNHELQVFGLAATGGFVGTWCRRLDVGWRTRLDGSQIRLRLGQSCIRRYRHR
jgi:FAD binding domain-containing protein